MPNKQKTSTSNKGQEIPSNYTVENKNMAGNTSKETGTKTTAGNTSKETGTKTTDVPPSTSTNINNINNEQPKLLTQGKGTEDKAESTFGKYKRKLGDSIRKHPFATAAFAGTGGLAIGSINNNNN